ncbi:peptide deformylase [Bacilli bacterium PM5-3]|nr:peptide deformylase [Bacilli bacterium PM5-3]MDH6602922.1 peptide deformylase [Bacilli bacterium PM5-9]
MNKILKQKHIKKEDIVMEPNDILKEVSSEVEIPLSKNDRDILKIMYNHVSNSQDEEYATKYDIRSAVGIAAVQIGITKRLLAIKTYDEDNNIHKYMLANPKYTYKSEQMAYLSNGEGCLSVEQDKYNGIVPRHYHIVVEAYNLLTNKIETIDVKGYVAIVLQHEMDHLDGLLYIDKINKLNPYLIKDEWLVI